MREEIELRRKDKQTNRGSIMNVTAILYIPPQSPYGWYWNAPFNFKIIINPRRFLVMPLFGQCIMRVQLE